MDNETNDRTEDAPAQPASTLAELKAWAAPTLERMELKDAMAGMANVGGDLGCS